MEEMTDPPFAGGCARLLPSLSLTCIHALQRKCRTQKPLGRRTDGPDILYRSVNAQSCIIEVEQNIIPTSSPGPEGQAYPYHEVAALAAREGRAKEGRRGRSLFSSLPSTLHPSVTQQRLLQAYGEAREGGLLSRTKREDTAGCVVGGAPPRLCKYVPKTKSLFNILVPNIRINPVVY